MRIIMSHNRERFINLVIHADGSGVPAAPTRIHPVLNPVLGAREHRKTISREEQMKTQQAI